MVIDGYIAGGSTVSLCALDLSKAFDKMNHHALFIKLMNRQVPINLLEIIENLFELSCTCIKWDLTYLILSSMSPASDKVAPCPRVSLPYLFMTLWQR